MHIQSPPNKLKTLPNLNSNKARSYNYIYWQCRRGMLELDQFLHNFCKLNYKTLPRAEKICFNRLLQENDSDLLAWFTGKTTPLDHALKNLILKIIKNKI